MNEDTLLQVHVVFRHGDRAPDEMTMYPKDPHKDDPYYPDGLGSLTLRGKKRQYDLGCELRERYNNFLGDIYNPDIMEARSTSYSRTKASLQLALAGLWPPRPSQVWHSELPWQPIPYTYDEMENDHLMQLVLVFSPKYIQEFDQVGQLPKYAGWMKKHSNKIEYINEHTGLKVTSLYQLFKLYIGLYIEEENGRELPEWTKKVYPAFLNEAMLLCYEQQVHNETLIRFGGGHLLKKIINDASAKMNNTIKPKDRKLFIYSGHEFNVVYLLAALNLYETHLPPYGAYLILEFHKINNVYGFKVFYQDYSSKIPKLLTIPGCDSFCPMDIFLNITKNVAAE